MSPRKRHSLNDIIDDYTSGMEKVAITNQEYARLWAQAPIQQKEKLIRLKAVGDGINTSANRFSNMVRSMNNIIDMRSVKGMSGLMRTISKQSGQSGFINQVVVDNIIPERGLWNNNASNNEREGMFSAYKLSLGYQTRLVAKEIFSKLAEKPFNTYPPEAQKNIRIFVASNPVDILGSKEQNMNQLRFLKESVGLSLAVRLSAKAQVMSKIDKHIKSSGLTDLAEIETMYTTHGAYDDEGGLRDRKASLDKLMLTDEVISSSDFGKAVVGGSLSNTKENSVLVKSSNDALRANTTISNTGVDEANIQNTAARFNDLGFYYTQNDVNRESEVTKLLGDINSSGASYAQTMGTRDGKTLNSSSRDVSLLKLNNSVLPGIPLGTNVAVSVINTEGKEVDIQLTKRDLINGLGTSSITLSDRGGKILNVMSSHLSASADGAVHDMTRVSYANSDEPINLTATDPLNNSQEGLISKVTNIKSAGMQEAEPYAMIVPNIMADSNGKIKMDIATQLSSRIRNDSTETVRQAEQGELVASDKSSDAFNQSTGVVIDNSATAVKARKEAEIEKSKTKALEIAGLKDSGIMDPRVMPSEYSNGDSHRSGYINQDIRNAKGVVGGGGYMSAGGDGSYKGRKLYDKFAKIADHRRTSGAMSALWAMQQGGLSDNQQAYLTDRVKRQFGTKAFDMASARMAGAERTIAFNAHKRLENATGGEKIAILNDTFEKRIKLEQSTGKYTPERAKALAAQYYVDKDTIVKGAHAKFIAANGKDADPKLFLSSLVKQRDAYVSNGNKTAYDISNNVTGPTTMAAFISNRNTKADKYNDSFMKWAKGRSFDNTERFSVAGKQYTEKTYMEAMTKAKYDEKPYVAPKKTQAQMVEDSKAEEDAKLKYRETYKEEHRPKTELENLRAQKKELENTENARIEQVRQDGLAKELAEAKRGQTESLKETDVINKRVKDYEKSLIEKENSVKFNKLTSRSSQSDLNLWF